MYGEGKQNSVNDLVLKFEQFNSADTQKCQTKKKLPALEIPAYRSSKLFHKESPHPDSISHNSPSENYSGDRFETPTPSNQIPSQENKNIYYYLPQNPLRRLQNDTDLDQVNLKADQNVQHQTADEADPDDNVSDIDIVDDKSEFRDEKIETGNEREQPINGMTQFEAENGEKCADFQELRRAMIRPTRRAVHTTSLATSKTFSRRAAKKVRAANVPSYVEAVGIINSNVTKSSNIDNNALKIKKIVDEFISTEEKYVSRLYLLDVEFKPQLARFNRDNYVMQWDDLEIIFSNISNIFKFHRDFLMPQLKTCKIDSENQPLSTVGHVFCELVPFLKIYTEYTMNFKKANETLEKYIQDSIIFLNFVKEFELRPECENLQIKHFFLEPIQRLPRYQLLLKEYSSHLPDDSDDLEASYKALEMVKEVANKSNESMKSEEKFAKIREIQEKIRTPIDLVGSPRELILEGDVSVAISSTGLIEDRRLFLFTDMLLSCEIFFHAFCPPYKLDIKILVDTMTIKAFSDRIFILGKENIMELRLRDHSEFSKWRNAFDHVIGIKKKKVPTATLR